MAVLDTPPAQDAAASRQARQARLDALRDAAQRLDPVRLHYLEVLSQRSAAAPEAVRRVLEARLDAALAELAQRLEHTEPAASDGEAPRPAAPLVALNRYIEGLRQPGDGPLPGVDIGFGPGPGLDLGLGPRLDARLNHGIASDADAHRELPSVTRFRETWSRIAAEDQVTQAVERGPANAGPLNSHMLVLRTLSLLRGLSPDYLRRFLSQMETLQWLEQASQAITPVKPKPARRSRVKK